MRGDGKLPIQNWKRIYFFGGERGTPNAPRKICWRGGGLGGQILKKRIYRLFFWGGGVVVGQPQPLQILKEFKKKKHTLGTSKTTKNIAGGGRWQPPKKTLKISTKNFLGGVWRSNSPSRQLKKNEIYYTFFFLLILRNVMCPNLPIFFQNISKGFIIKPLKYSIIAPFISRKMDKQ